MHAKFKPKLLNPPKALSILIHIAQTISREKEKIKLIYQNVGLYQFYGVKQPSAFLHKPLHLPWSGYNPCSASSLLIDNSNRARTSPSKHKQLGFGSVLLTVPTTPICKFHLCLSLVRGCPSLRPLSNNVLL